MAMIIAFLPCQQSPLSHLAPSASVAGASLGIRRHPWPVMPLTYIICRAEGPWTCPVPLRRARQRPLCPLILLATCANRQDLAPLSRQFGGLAPARRGRTAVDPVMCCMARASSYRCGFCCSSGVVHFQFLQACREG